MFKMENVQQGNFMFTPNNRHANLRRMYNHFLAIFPSQRAFRPSKCQKSSQSSKICNINKISAPRAKRRKHENQSSPEKMQVIVRHKIIAYPPLSRIWRSTRMAHTNFPERTQSDSVSTALLSLHIHLNCHINSL